MDTELKVTGFWPAGDVADLIEEQTGHRPAVTTVDDCVIVHDGHLSTEEIVALRQYFEERPQKSAIERKAEEERELETRRSELVKTVTVGTGSSSSLEELRAAVEALSEWVGIIPDVPANGRTK